MTNANDMPLVSIVMNCYNGERYLQESIESVLVQSYDKWEFIFWDNQSTDASAKIFKSYDDKRLKYFLATKHSVLYEARNRALTHCKGKYIAFLDSDDVWNERKLEKQMNKYRENRYLSLVYTKRTFIDDKSNIIRCDDSKKIHGKVTNKLLIKNFIPMSSVLIDREVFNMVGVFNPMYNLLGDYDMWVKISIVGYIDCVDEKMLNDRVHIGSTTIRNRNKWIIEQRFFYFNFLRKYKLKYLSVVYYVVRTELANIIRKYLVNK